MDVAELNLLRIQLKAALAAPGNPPPKVWVRCDTSEDDIGEAGKTLASELGLRFVPLNLAHGITDEHRLALGKPGPRLVVIRNLGLTPPADLPALVEEGQRSLILIEVRLDEESYRRFNLPPAAA